MTDIVSVGSSSSGNSYIIMAEGRTFILDAGLPAKKIIGALEHLGTDPEEVEAVLITHEHTDHVKSVRAISSKCCNAHFYTSRGTAGSAAGFQYVPEDRLHIIKAGEIIDAGNIRIHSFSLSHDAREPLGFSVEAGGEKLSVVTDTGVITDEIYEAIRDADKLVFEANHDEHMLMFGDYPYPVKVRIKSDLGHLSNVYAGGVLARILSDRRQTREAGNKGGFDAKPLRIMLAHLSFHNNMPLFARQTVEGMLEEAGFLKGQDYVLDVAAKEGLTFMPSAHGGEKYSDA